MSVTATFDHQDGYKFNIHYKTRGGFLRAIAKNKNTVLDHAVDHSLCVLVRNNNLQAYKDGKLK